MSRDAFLNERLQRFLTERRVPPRSLSSAAAQAQEIRALSRIVLSRAPIDGFEEWWDEVETFIGTHAQTRAWPTEKEMLDAVSAARVPARPGAQRDWKIDSHVVNAQRIKTGEAVGDDWLWGKFCVEMIGRGLCSEHDLRGHRAAFRAALVATYGDEEADRLIDLRRKRHEDAKAVSRGDVAYFVDGPGTYRPRLMQDAIAGPKDDGAWRKAEPQRELTTEEIASRPYTEEERARMRALRPRPDPETPAEEAQA